MADWSDKDMHLYSSRLIEISPDNWKKNQIVGTADGVTVQWATQPHLGIALWDPKEQRFFVFPLCNQIGNYGSVLSLYPEELPRVSKKNFLEILRKGVSIHCQNGPITENVSVSSDIAGVGIIDVTSNETGLELDYTGAEQYLF